MACASSLEISLKNVGLASAHVTHTIAELSIGWDHQHDLRMDTPPGPDRCRDPTPPLWLSPQSNLALTHLKRHNVSQSLAQEPVRLPSPATPPIFRPLISVIDTSLVFGTFLFAQKGVYFFYSSSEQFFPKPGILSYQKVGESAWNLFQQLFTILPSVFGDFGKVPGKGSNTKKICQAPCGK